MRTTAMKHKTVAPGLVLAAAIWVAMAVASPASAGAACPYASGPLPDPSVKLTPLGSLTIPSIGLQTPVFQGWFPDLNSLYSKALNNGPAFYPPNTLPGYTFHRPGQGGTVAMLGHRTTHTHPMCLAADIRSGYLAIVQMPYGTYYYREVAQVSVPPNDWEAFTAPTSHDPEPARWNSGLKPEYLVIGACDPPHQSVRRLDTIFKLVEERLK